MTKGNAQLACHPDLCPPTFIEEVRASRAAADEAAAAAAAGIPAPANDQVGPAMSMEERKALQRTLLEIKDEDCPICFGTPEEPIITPCAHAYCLGCAALD